MLISVILLSDFFDGMDLNFLNSLNLEFIVLNERFLDFFIVGFYK